MLGVDVPADEIVYQDYNPYPKSKMFPREFTFVDQGEFSAKTISEDDADAKSKSKESKTLLPDAFNPQNEITAGLQQVLFPYTGSIFRRNASNVEFIPLAKTGRRTGTVKLSDLLRMSPMGPQGLQENPRRTPTGVEYVLAAEIRGKADLADDKQNAADPAEKSTEKTPAPKENEMHVVLVSDIDLMADDFFRLRELGANNPDMDINFNFDNVTFILNILDAMAGDRRYIEIRKHRPKYRTLERIDQETEEARNQATKTREQFNEDFEKGKPRCGPTSKSGWRRFATARTSIATNSLSGWVWPWSAASSRWIGQSMSCSGNGTSTSRKWNGKKKPNSTT